VRLVHLSDLHLGFRAFSRVERGWNLRERDMASAFRWAIQEIVRHAPDLVLLSGDVFDRPDPPNTAYLALQRGLGILRAHLPGTQVLAIAGERDTPKSPGDPGPLAVLDGLPGVEAAAGAPRAVRFREAGLHVLLVPHRAILEPPFPALRPDPAARWNILVIRGMVTGHPGALPIRASEWSYVAVGGAHEATRWADRVWSAGALERPGRNPWEAATEERGFLTFDLEQGVSEFHAVPGRPVVDLAPVRVSPGDPEPGTRRLRDLLEGIPGGTDGRIVRIRLRGDVLAPGDAVSEGLLSAIRGRAAHAEFQLLGEGESAAGRPAAKRSREAVLRVEVSEDGRPAEIPLGTGLVLVTAPTESDRARIVRAFRGLGRGVEALEPFLPALRILPPGEGPAVGAFDESEGEDPASLVRALLSQGSRTLLSPIAGGPDPDRIEGTVEDLPAMEGALTELRADSIEAAGDLEAKTLEWARDRQEADTKLLDYRDRARELTNRIRLLRTRGEESRCPTCGRPLGTEAARLVQALTDELEAVVQDGKWWKKRRAQLDEKPKELQSMEERALRLHARVEEEAERLQRAREGRTTPEAAASRAHRPGSPEGGARAESPDLETLPGVRGLLRRSANLVSTMTEGRISGLRIRGARVLTVGAGGREEVPEGMDLAGLRMAIRHAAWEARGGSGDDPGPLLLTELGGPAPEPFASQAIEAVSERLGEGGLVVVVAPPSVVENLSERLARALELTLDPRGRWIVRRIPAGTPLLAIAEEG